MAQNSQEVIKARRDKVERLMYAGMRQADIANECGVSRMQIVADLRVIRRQHAREMDKIKVKELISELHIRGEARIRQLWKIVVSGESSPGEKAQALRALREEDKDFVEREQIVNRLPSIPRVAIQQNITAPKVVVVWEGDQQGYPGLDAQGGPKHIEGQSESETATAEDKKPAQEEHDEKKAEEGSDGAGGA